MQDHEKFFHHFKMNMKLLTLLVALLPVLVATNDTTQMKAQIQALTTLVSQQGSLIQKLVKKDRTRDGYCQFKVNPCGDCMCFEDLRMVEKYYCDCREKPIRRDCKEHYDQGERTNGIYRINKNLKILMIQVFCDQTTDGGGWTVVQRRVDGSENFLRNWAEYRVGFGLLHREHFLGNRNIYLLTAQAYWKGSELRVDMVSKSSSSRLWAKYSSFEVNNEASGFELHVSGYSGNALDRLTYHNGMKFTTYDKEHDNWSGGNCAIRNAGGWWYDDCATANLNGNYDQFQSIAQSCSSDCSSVFWRPYHLKYSEMKIRRV
ncbi:microfibril-associated glycoprotein 4-like [Clytia hemisphaerica]|uniref:microfibril-associated glycoprotein 4-like n=1 Tax=Clytia hemisphaerica TaxID=252671 RepID=UPI0034D64FB1